MMSQLAKKSLSSSNKLFKKMVSECENGRDKMVSLSVLYGASILNLDR